MARIYPTLKEMIVIFVREEVNHRSWYSYLPPTVALLKLRYEKIAGQVE